jgi:hypothetical protein
MKNRKIYDKVLKSYKEISKEVFGNYMEYYKIHIIYEIIDEINGQGLDITDEEEEKLCDYIYEVYLEYDGTNINIYNIVYTVSSLTQYGMTIEDILKMDISDFIDNIII